MPPPASPDDLVAGGCDSELRVAGAYKTRRRTGIPAPFDLGVPETSS